MTRYLTAVIRLPDDPQAAKTVTGALTMFGDFHGGTVTSLYAGDAISENMIFERNADPHLVKAVRDEVAAHPG